MLEDMAPTERMQDATNDIPPGLNASDMTVLQSRRISVRAELDRIGASPDFCRNYFQSASGKCEEQRGCACVKHATSAFTLPKGKMGEAEFRTYALELEGRIVGAKSNVDRYRAGYRELTADGFLATGIPEREVISASIYYLFKHGLLSNQVIARNHSWSSAAGRWSSRCATSTGFCSSFGGRSTVCSRMSSRSASARLPPSIPTARASWMSSRISIVCSRWGASSPLLMAAPV